MAGHVARRDREINDAMNGMPGENDQSDVSGKDGRIVCEKMCSSSRVGTIGCGWRRRDPTGGGLLQRQEVYMVSDLQSKRSEL